MNKLIIKITIGLAMISTVSINSVKPTFAATQDYNMQEIEESIYDHLEDWDTSFRISYYEQDVLDLIKKVAKKDDYLDISLTRLEYRSRGTEATVNVTYRTTIEQENYINNELKRILNSIISTNMSDFDKVKAINKYLIDRYQYDYSLVSNNAYTALTTGKTTCQGYAMTTYKMLKLAGLENRIITGTLNGVAHGWNLVKVDGQWYHLDITNNDSTNSSKYFLKSDDVLRKEGFQWVAEDYPKCNSSYDQSATILKYNSYWHKQGYSWYFMKSSGYNATGWNYIGGKWYYFGADGKMKTGWIYDNRKWYYLSNNGDMRTGWIYDRGNWYYCWSNGQMAANTTIDGYILNGSGAWVR